MTAIQDKLVLHTLTPIMLIHMLSVRKHIRYHTLETAVIVLVIHTMVGIVIKLLITMTVIQINFAVMHGSKVMIAVVGMDAVINDFA